ncbi:MAG: SAM-dependent methyltransferase [Candidatus Omnitrophica bacterium]|nr:SAM-dependent methyltransferase [Candidatus Omnitrophota bacterium]
MYPIGVVKNNLKLNGTDFGVTGEYGLSRVELLDSRKFFLYKIDEETRVTIVYYLHKSSNVRSVFNRGLDGKKVGVFASRTPHRLSKIAIQDVKLVKVEGVKLYVEGLDAIDGSPVLDIKMNKCLAD